ncbi:MAG: hypothetical protein K2P86_11130 [Xanthobacteraceae bacterium]|nr:hypothetical protein [Xanthobacteraceae bacterium]
MSKEPEFLFHRRPARRADNPRCIFMLFLFRRYRRVSFVCRRRHVRSGFLRRIPAMSANFETKTPRLKNLSAPRLKPEADVRRKIPEDDWTIAALCPCAIYFSRRVVPFTAPSHCNSSFAVAGAGATR